MFTDARVGPRQVRALGGCSISTSSSRRTWFYNAGGGDGGGQLEATQYQDPPPELSHTAPVLIAAEAATRVRRSADGDRALAPAVSIAGHLLVLVHGGDSGDGGGQLGATQYQDPPPELSHVAPVGPFSLPPKQPPVYDDPLMSIVPWHQP